LYRIRHKAVKKRLPTPFLCSYQHLKSEKPGILGTEAIKWNFTKFLVGSDGTVLKRYAPSDKPEMIEADLAEALAD